MAEKLSSLNYPEPLNDRLVALAEKRSKQLGLTKTLSRPQILEMLVAEEEKRQHENKNNQTDKTD